jgi:hypothetical protein
MAFLSKQKKFMKIFPSTETFLGPGQYLPITKVKVSTQNHVPFLSSEQRTVTTATSPKSSVVPGPGSYYKDDLSFKLKKNHLKQKIFTELNKDRMRNSTSNINHHSKHPSNKVLYPTTNNSVVELSFNITNNTKRLPTALPEDNIEPIGFNIQDKRFKTKTISNDIPGPGFYFTNSNNKVISNSKSKKNKTITAIDLTITNALNYDKLCNCSTIPTKERKYGYDYAPNGMLIPKENPNFYRTFTGDKDDMVGPGNYELCLPEQWHKTGTEWSKFNKVKEVPKHKHIKDEIMYALSRESENTEEAAMYRTMQNFTKANIIKQNTLPYKYNIKTMNNEIVPKQGMLDAFMKPIKNNPGPGYYYIEKNRTAFNTDKGSKTYRLNFIEGNTLTFTENKVNDNQVSPATYFREDLKSLKRLKHKYCIDTLNRNESSKQRTKQQHAKTMIGFNSTTYRFTNYKKSHSLSLDEQTYNLIYNHNNNNINTNRSNTNPSGVTVYGLNKKSFNFKNANFPFGTTGLRFNPKVHDPFNLLPEKDIPGPGTYINPYSATGAMNTVILGNRLTNIENAKKLCTTQADKTKSLKIPHNPPAVGLYSPDTVQSIEYQNLKNSAKSKNVPFNSTLSKVINSVNSDNNKEVGPGSYIQFNKKQKFQVVPPFKTGAERSFHKNGFSNEKVVGVGTYDVNKSYPWRKKEFNALYINNNNNTNINN